MKPNFQKTGLEMASTRHSRYFFNYNNLQKQKQFESNYFNFSDDQPISNQNTINDLINLKIPTTPTRSKSLSPSPRQALKPLRIRHKLLQPKIKLFSQGSAFKSCQPLSCQSVKTLDSISNSDETSTLSDLTSIYSVKSNISEQCNTSKDCLDHSIRSIPHQRHVTIRLPSNVRTLNLNNFPANQPHSIAYKRMKKIHNDYRNQNNNLEILQENLQYIFDKRLKVLTDSLRRELIEPGLKKLEGQQTNSDLVDMLVLNLIEGSTFVKSKKRKLSDNEPKANNNENSIE